MHYIWHNCGYIVDMMEDMIDIGVDVVQLDQPRLMGYDQLTEKFGGRFCFWNTADIQWTTQEAVTNEQIEVDIEEMVGSFNRFNGGFIARHYPQPDDIHLSQEKQLLIYESFKNHGCDL